MQRLAPEARRVDLTVPSFPDPTTITNPLFPIGHLTSAVPVGELHGQPWRAETTLLPGTEAVAWNGQQVRTLRSQFVAYLDGRIFEVAVDRYAQADDGSVWYFSEDAYTYRRGRVADTEGTWLAGVTGPPAMIIRGHPKVGAVYRTENIPGLVFEQVTVKEVGVTVDGPVGAVTGAMVGQELHMDEVRLELRSRLRRVLLRLASNLRGERARGAGRCPLAAHAGRARGDLGGRHGHLRRGAVG